MFRFRNWALVKDPQGSALHFPGGLVFKSHLTAVIVRANGKTEFVDLGSGLVTNAGAALIAADWTSATAALKLANYHDIGTGTTAAAVTDVALQTPGINHGTRKVGVQSNPTSQVYRTASASFVFSGTEVVTEWGLFTAAAAGTMLDRKVFAALNFATGDLYTPTYDLSIVSGG